MKSATISNLKQARLDAGLSLIELSKLTGFSKQSLSMYEQNKATPKSKERKQILCKALQKSEEELFDYNTHKYKNECGTKKYKKIEDMKGSISKDIQLAPNEYAIIIKKYIPTNLKLYRFNAGYTRKELARKANCSLSEMTAIETGNISSKDNLVALKICNALNVNFDKVFEEIEVKIIKKKSHPLTNLERAIYESGYTLTQFADEMYYTRQFIQYVCRKKNKPSLNFILKSCKILNKTFEELFGDWEIEEEE